MIRRKIMVWIILCVMYSAVLFAQDQQVFKKASSYNELGIQALQEKNYIQCIEYLREAYSLMPGNKTIRKNLALAYNNYGIELAEQEAYDNSLRNMEHAIEIYPEVQYKENLANILLNNATDLYKDGEPELAQVRLKRSIEMYPMLKDAYVLLGQLLYETGDLHKAHFYWDKVNRLFPGDKNIVEKLKRVNKEKYIEDDYKGLDIVYFDIRYDEDIVDGNEYRLREILKDARREVGRDFRYYPKRKIPVIVYKRADFDEIRNGPGWIAAVFDGKIRIPVAEAKINLDTMTHLIAHEYTHAVIFDITSGHCPTWLNEGLAMYEESKKQKIDITLLKTAYANNTLIPLSELDSVFKVHSSYEKLRLAYIESFSFVSYFLDRWNFYVLMEVLSLLQDGVSLDKAFYETVYRSQQRLEKEWKEYFGKML